MTWPETLRRYGKLFDNFKIVVKQIFLGTTWRRTTVRMKVTGGKLNVKPNKIKLSFPFRQRAGKSRSSRTGKLFVSKFFQCLPNSTTCALAQHRKIIILMPLYLTAICFILRHNHLTSVLLFTD